MGAKKILSIMVNGLQEVFNYNFSFPPSSDIVILIAPNGYGKTAFLSLIRDCVRLDIKRISTHSFEKLIIEFDDHTKWLFSKNRDEYSLNESYLHEIKFGKRKLLKNKNKESVIFKEIDKDNNEINDDYFSDYGYIRSVFKDIPYLDIIGKNEILDLRDREIYTFYEAINKFSDQIENNHSINDIFNAPIISLIRGKKIIDCMFIDTQRLLYSKLPDYKGNEGEFPKEEILRQAKNLSILLNKNYSDYAARSQQLDRSFPTRLISRAQSRSPISNEGLRQGLREIEKKRTELTEAGILVDQTDNIISTDDEFLPKVADALQIYVEDSQDKLSTYDKIFPKISVFRELVSKKLYPKRIVIGREFGVSIFRGVNELELSKLSSGEKHEFIMLYKLIFETPENALVLIDEPEISLHVVWQLEFLSDLRRIQGTNPFQSIIATHSPQIFQGFEHLVVDLADQVNELG